MVMMSMQVSFTKLKKNMKRGTADDVSKLIECLKNNYKQILKKSFKVNQAFKRPKTGKRKKEESLGSKTTQKLNQLRKTFLSKTL